MKVTTGLASLFLLTCIINSSFAQIRPPTLSTVTPYGGRRGTTATFIIEGTNLGEATQLLFDDSAISTRILKNEDLGLDKAMRAPGSTAALIEDRASKNRLTIETTISPAARLGRHSFRIRTPLGTTNLGSIFVGAQPEEMEKEPNNSSATAQKTTLPVTLTGTIDSASDADHFQVDATAGQELVFEVVAAALGSNLDSTLTLMDAKGRVLATNEDFNKSADSVLGYTFSQAGSYTVRVSDGVGGGSRRHFYRLTIGELPFVTSFFPLGVPKPTGGEIALAGFNLGSLPRVRVGPAKETPMETIALPVPADTRAPLNLVRVAAGNYTEADEREPNNLVGSAQQISAPVTINGRIGADGRSVDQDIFGFQAKKGQQVVFSVMAQRLGSPLDSNIEILDSKGRPIPRAVLRPVWQTSTTLNDRDSLSQGLRLDAWSGIAPGDFVMVGNELVQVVELPKSPDADVIFRGFRGRRQAFEGTTPQGHPINSPVYKVEIHPPGAAFPANGMPLFHLSYRNDDGGPVYGKDSYLTFTAPEDGQYYVRITDVLGKGGDSYAYRLTVAKPSPDFTLTVSPANPNVPRGGRVPITVTASRVDGFDGSIDVRVSDLPEGFEATAGVIQPGQASVALVLSTSDKAAQAGPATFTVSGRAEINNREVVRQTEAGANLNVISLASPPDLYISSVSPQQIEIEPGGRAKVNVRIRRANGFEGRVPVSVLNLPFLLSVPDIGLNGILIVEKEESRDFFIVAEPNALPSEQTIVVTARVETNSPLSSEHASLPIKLKVVSRQTAGTR
jgi:hypothetical protein